MKIVIDFGRKGLGSRPSYCAFRHVFYPDMIPTETLCASLHLPPRGILVYADELLELSNKILEAEKKLTWISNVSREIFTHKNMSFK